MAIGVIAAGALYYFSTRLAWLLTFPDSKVSLFFPPHAVLISVLLLVPTRHWWAYVLAAIGSHFIATQQAGWPPLYALQCEAFDAVKILVTATGVRWLVKSPFHRIRGTARCHRHIRCSRRRHWPRKLSRPIRSRIS